MEIKRNGSQASSKGPDDWFTGTVRIDSPFTCHYPHLDRCLLNDSCTKHLYKSVVYSDWQDVSYADGARRLGSIGV